MRRPATALAAGIVLLRAALPSAHAQENTSTRAAVASDNTKVAEVVGTGRGMGGGRGLDYGVPGGVIGGDDIREGGYTFLGDSLANLPQSLATTGIQNTSGSLFTAGESRVSLRGLGTQRTLVLVDGRRHVTGDFQTSAVDLNVIPSSMVERVEAIPAAPPRFMDRRPS